MLATVAVIVFLIALGYAAVRDLMSYEIPNWVSLAIVADFVVLGLAGAASLADIGWHLSAGAVVLLLGAALFFGGIFGGGDAKLLAACAVWAGWSQLPALCLAVGVLGGLLALIILALRHVRLPAAWTAAPWLQRLRAAEQGIPYGVAIGLGTLAVLRDIPAAAGL